MAGTGGDMLDSSAEFSEGLTVRPTTTGKDFYFCFRVPVHRRAGDLASQAPMAHL